MKEKFQKKYQEIGIKKSLKDIGYLKEGELVIVEDKGKLLLVTKDIKGRFKKIEFVNLEG